MPEFKFYVTEFVEGDPKVAGISCATFTNTNMDKAKAAAVASWHKRLGIAGASDLYDSDLCMVIDSADGTIVKREKYVKVVEPKPEPEEPKEE